MNSQKPKQIAEIWKVDLESQRACRMRYQTHLLRLTTPHIHWISFTGNFTSEFLRDSPEIADELGKWNRGQTFKCQELTKEEYFIYLL